MKHEAPRSRVVIRIAVWAMHHATSISLASCVLGLLSLALLPAFTKNVYVDENALLPASAREAFQYSDAANARSVALQLRSAISASPDKHTALQKWFVSQFENIGGDYYFQRFCPPANSFSFGFFALTHSYDQCRTDQAPGMNAVGIIRAPRGDGNEAIVLVTPFELESFTLENAMALGLASSLCQLLSRSPWLAKDIIWVAADSKYGDYTGVAAWLKEYHEPNLHGRQLDETETLTTFKRAGRISAGLVLKLNRSSEGNTLQIEAEGSNGQMPNMDMISVVNLLVSWRWDFRLKVDEKSSIRNWQWLKSAGQLVQDVSKAVAELRRTYLSHSKAGYVTADEYVGGVATLLSSCEKQMLGVPTGPHGAFRDYQVDAITLKVGAAKGANDVQLLLNFGRLVEGVLRSVSNLLEKFHASLFLYLMVSPTTFVSISTYMVPLALLLISFPIQAAFLFTKSNAPVSDWIQAMLVILSVEAWSLGTAILPTLINQLDVSNATKPLLWVCLSSLSLVTILVFLPLESPRKSGSFIPLKASMLGLTGIALGVMSAVDFSVALAGCLLLLPMSLFTQPLSVAWKSVSKPGGISQLSALLSAVFLLWPAVIVLGTTSIGLVQLWSWAETMWFWGSALYIFVFLVQLPCCVVCLYIMQC